MVSTWQRATLLKLGKQLEPLLPNLSGEPGTQLTMRTFHTGGVASNTDITQGFLRSRNL